MLGGDELEVDSVDNRPDLPGSLASAEEIVLDLVSNGSQRVSIHQSKVGKENTHEDGAVFKEENEAKLCEIVSIMSCHSFVRPKQSSLSFRGKG